MMGHNDSTANDSVWPCLAAFRTPPPLSSRLGLARRGGAFRPRSFLFPRAFPSQSPSLFKAAHPLRVRRCSLSSRTQIPFSLLFLEACILFFECLAAASQLDNPTRPSAPPRAPIVPPRPSVRLSEACRLIHFRTQIKAIQVSSQSPLRSANSCATRRSHNGCPCSIREFQRVRWTRATHLQLRPALRSLFASYELGRLLTVIKALESSLD